MNLSDAIIQIKTDPALSPGVRQEAMSAVAKAIQIRGGNTPLRVLVAMLGSSALAQVLGKYLGVSPLGSKLLAALGAGLGTAAAPGNFFEHQHLDYKGDPWKL